MRLEWAYDSDALLTCVDGTLRRHVGDASQILDGPTLLDARWRPDGSIVSIDNVNQLRRYADGETLELPRPWSQPFTAARLAPTDRYAAAGAHRVSVVTFDGKEEWTSSYGDVTSSGRLEIEASDDLRYVAVATESLLAANFHWQTAEGRSWLAFDTRKNSVVDRQWVKAKRGASLVKLAFDGTGKRLAVALPGAASVGAIRVDKDEIYPQEHLGGARAVAFDARGLIAAYAYPTGVGPRRLRVDYLERGVKGDARIPITETLWIDPDLEDVVAIAFDRASRRIACLGASGAIEIVPVP